MAIASAIGQRVHELALQDFAHAFGKPEIDLESDPEWRKVTATGTELWLDTGDLDAATELFTREFSALTTNNTLLNKEVQKGIYDDLVGRAAHEIRQAAPAIDPQDLVLEIAFLLNAVHALKLVSRFDARVSVELHTDLADDVERSVDYGRRYYAICPERFIIKVPLTPAGLLAARALGDEGIPVNFTLGFSARQNYLAALVARPWYVNVFMGRLGAFVADFRLGDGSNIGEKATLATQREILALRESGRGRSNLIGASMRKGEQVTTLAGLDVFTMPTKVAAEWRANPPAEVSSRVQDDPDVPLADGVEFADFNGATVWEVADDFRACADSLAARPLTELTPGAVVDHMSAGGFGDVFPRWSDEDLRTIQNDGKIPNYHTWKGRLSSGEVGLDALMNAAALLSFTTDQAELDERIRQHL